MAGRAAYAALFDPGPAGDSVSGVGRAASGHAGADARWIDSHPGAARLVRSLQRARTRRGTGARGYPNLSIVEVPNASYNALGGSDCPRRIRNVWIDDLAPPSVDPTCETALPDLVQAP